MPIMTQDELDAALASAGGGRLAHAQTVGTKTIKNPQSKLNGGPDARAPEELTLDVEQWKSAQGHTIQAIHMPDGSWNVIQNEPPAKPASETGLTPAQQNDAALLAQRQKNAALPADQDPRYETDEERAKRADATIADQGTRARQGEQDARQQQQDARQKEIDADTRRRQQAADAAAATKAGEPQVVYREIKQPDGSTKNVQVRVYPGGREEVVPSKVPGQPAPREPIRIERNPSTGELEEVYRDPVTGQARTRPVQGQTAATRPGRAPSMPQIVVGQSQDALRTAYDQIQEEVDSGRRTAAWGENRRKEVLDAAQLTVQEAQLGEQSRQANQTTRFNQSSSLMTYGQNALENALKYSLQVNDNLPVGSDLGAKMFGALFTMQMKMAVDSGMYGLGVPKGSSFGKPGQPAAAKPRLSNPGDADAVEADRQRAAAEARAHPVFSPQPPVELPPTAAEPGGPPLAPGPVLGDPTAGLPEGRPDQTQAAAQIEGAIMPPAAAPPPFVFSPLPGNPAAAATPPGGMPPAGIPERPGTREAGGLPGYPAGPSVNPDGSPDYGAPGMRVLPPPAAQPSSYGAGGDTPVGMAPSGYAALDALGASMGPVPSINPMAQQVGAGAGLPPALMHAEVAATPPWKLPHDQLQRLVDQYGEGAVFGYPGAHLVGLG